MIPILKHSRIHAIITSVAILAVILSVSARESRGQAENLSRAQALEVAKDEAAARETRLEAIKALSFSESAEEKAALLGLVRDQSEDHELRLEAAKTHHFDDNLLSAVIPVLRDEEDQSGELHAGLIKYLGRRLKLVGNDTVRAELLSAIRALCTDPVPAVSHSALEALVPVNDPGALAIVKEGLANPEEGDLPAPRAINLLHQAGATEHAKAIRPFLESADEAICVEAIRALSLDSTSLPKIREYAADRSRSTAIRVTAVKSLSRGSATFPAEATAILGNPAGEEEEVLRVTMAELVGYLRYHQVPSAEFDGIISLFETLSTSEDLDARLKSDAAELHLHLKHSPIFKRQ